MLVYKGCILEHWREPFQGNECCQVFLHYNNALSDFAEQNKYDKRPHFVDKYFYITIIKQLKALKIISLTKEHI
jgi:hypothetical protein